MWVQNVAPDGSAWPVVTSGSLASVDDGDRVRLWNRHGVLFAEFVLPAGDGAPLLERLGMRASP
jgi:hypothetical protein